MVWSTSESLGTSENLSQSTNTNVGSDVYSASNGGSSGVHPVSVIRSEFLKSGSLDDVSPLRSDIFQKRKNIKNVPLGSQTYLGSSSAWRKLQ